MPTYKEKGSRSCASSYRPISLCKTLGKALERLVRDQILSIVNFTKPLCDLQHAYIKGRSTVSNLLCAENESACALNSREPYDIFTLDFSRAFDRVPHHLLLEELSNRIITGSAFQWVQSFLRERTQAVRISEVLTSSVTITSGLIQGSSLKFTLFTIFIDSLLAELNIPASAYADDLKSMANLTHHRRS